MIYALFFKNHLHISLEYPPNCKPKYFIGDAIKNINQPRLEYLLKPKALSRFTLLIATKNSSFSNCLSNSITNFSESYIILFRFLCVHFSCTWDKKKKNFNKILWCPWMQISLWSGNTNPWSYLLSQDYLVPLQS